MAQASAKALQKSLSQLQISQNAPATKARRAEPADSWEDEADGNDGSSDTETEIVTPPVKSADDAPAPPPPTPSSPTAGSLPIYMSDRSPYRTYPPYGLDGAGDSNSSSGASTPSRREVSASAAGDRRPEKSTAVASRLIAAGIGQKAPRRTKEEREYDQAMRVQEKKRREQARDEEKKKQAEKEKAIKDVWDG